MQVTKHGRQLSLAKAEMREKSKYRPPLSSREFVEGLGDSGRAMAGPTRTHRQPIPTQAIPGGR